MASAPVVLITAGSAGLGAAAARLFARNSYNVVINYSSDSARAEKLVSELGDIKTAETNGNSHLAIKADLASHEEVKRLVSETHQAMGRIDVIFSNGGWSHFRDITRLDDNVFDEDWDRAYAMNVKSHLWLLHAAESHLAKTEGAFITTASVAGMKGTGSSLVSFGADNSKYL
jgi:NAD(P)-dependent dehydrogenase (short-subunit alcohol dehydrogenase family)